MFTSERVHQAVNTSWSTVEDMHVKSEFRIHPLQYHLYYMRPNGYVKKKLEDSLSRLRHA
jgi:hypothetical protein